MKNKLSSAIVCFVKAFHHFNVYPTINITRVKAPAKILCHVDLEVFNGIFDDDEKNKTHRENMKKNLSFGD